AFGALVAAGLPLLLALTAVFATMGVLALPSHLIPLDKDVSVIVLLIGLTVMVAMAGMLFTGDQTFMGFGVATMIVVAIAVLGSLTVLPATLAALGDNVDRLRVPFLHKSNRVDGGGQVWSAILDRVLRRPIVSIVLAGGLLLALAA